MNISKKPENHFLSASPLKKGTEFTENVKSPLQKKEEKRKLQKKVSAEDVYNLCKKKLSLSEIAKKLGLTSASVAIYIERLLRKGYAIDINAFVQSGKCIEIEELFLTLQTSSIKRIAENLHGRATVEDIRIVRGYLQGKLHTERE